MHEIKPSDLGELLRGRMGLILGPSITKYASSFSDLARELAEKNNVPPGGTFLDVSDRLLDSGIPEAKIIECIREIVGHQAASAVLTHLTKARWAAVLSAALDSHFEDGFQQENQRSPSRQLVTVLGDLLTPPPPRTIPVFKLLGLIARDGFAYSSVSYVRRRLTWRHAVKGFADLVHGNPVLCLGMDDCPWLLLDLIGEMLGERGAAPSALVFLADDPVHTNLKVRQLLQQRVKQVIVRGAVGDVARAATTAAKTGFPRSIPFPDADEDTFAKIRHYSDFVVIVNEQLTPGLQKTEHNQLLDLLFAPSVTRWDPYAYELDLPRSLAARLLPELNQELADRERTGVACVVTGAAVTGKTVLLKRLAFDLARSNYPVLWFKPWSSSESGRVLRDFFRDVASMKAWLGKRIVVVMDDPASYGSLTPKELSGAAHAHDVPVLLLTAVRTSEWRSYEQSDLVGALPVTIQEELPDNLNNEEWARLPAYLVALGVLPTVEAAQSQVNSVQTQSAQDTLSTLYYLLPQTRVAITSSLRDEYFRLGDVTGLARVIAHAVQAGTDLLRRAYEMVAVADHYRARLPVEVLVSALGVDYGAWIDASGPKSAVWGLLYSEESDDGQTVWYRTRNDIVTRTIVHTINGGSLGHTGELRVLIELLRACTGRTSPVYRQFCIRVLVPHEKLDTLSYEEGLQLFDTALAALPFPEKTILHHKGLWEKNKGRNALGAKAILEQALATSDYPYTDRGEADEHIHTSIAATVLDGVTQGVISLEEGKRDILAHLSKARSSSFFNPRSVHVQANLISHLADKVSSTQAPDYFTLINQAVEDVDHALLLMHSHVMESSHAVSDVRMLEGIRDQILLKVASPEELKEHADQVWQQYQSQQGFVLVARKLYVAAQAKNKKYDLAFSYCQRAILTVQEAGQTPIPALYAVAIQVYYHWRVRRQVVSGTGSIDWTIIRDHSAALMSSPEYAKDPLHRYLYALALANLGQWPSANAIFSQFRQSELPRHVLWQPRDFLLNSTGGVRTVQGVMRSGPDRQYLFVEDLQTDFHVSRNGRWPNDGEIAHATIQFSFAGATALDTY
jgi:hypothetical protein